MYADGSKLTDLSAVAGNTTQSDQDPSFSPDGTHIVFDRYADGNGDMGVGLFGVSADGTSTSATKLLRDTFAVGPTFSPNGTKVAFLHEHQNNNSPPRLEWGPTTPRIQAH